jgi:ergothioneine biosynthesis protein EgtB
MRPHESSLRLLPQAETALAENYRTTRVASENLCAPLAVEEYVIQAMADASPPKWHLAHTAWFFERFVLVPYLGGYTVFHPCYGHLFNSYYETVGSYFPRSRRGLLARPTVEGIYRYRAHVDAAMAELLAAVPWATRDEVAFRTMLGIHHEQQHQELLLADIQYNFSVNPLRPAYHPAAERDGRPAPPLAWVDHTGGLCEIGHADDGFAYDNETPRHAVYLRDYRLASRPATNGEYLEFMEAGGYRRPEFWLADGWGVVQREGWEAPLYWERIDGGWWRMGLGGFAPVDVEEPVCHVSFYEADAYARWRGSRLPTEAEWESATAGRAIVGNFRESGLYRPVAAPESPPGEPTQLFGDVWEWTRSGYAPYPGFRPLAGPLGEYNGKFMCNQMVLRGGSCATPRAHIRASYRNFFYPSDRWQFTGVRLAGDAL